MRSFLFTMRPFGLNVFDLITFVITSALRLSDIVGTGGMILMFTVACCFSLWQSLRLVKEEIERERDGN